MPLDAPIVSTKTGLSFYRFPVDPDRRGRWLAAVKRKLAAQREFMYGSSTDPGSISSFHRTSALLLHPGPPHST